MRIAIADADQKRSQAMRLFLEADGHQTAWHARDCVELLAKVAGDHPDVLLLDIELPRDAVAVTKQVMGGRPCPILIVASAFDDHKARVFEAIAAGAVDAVAMPRSHETGAVETMEPLRARMRMIARLFVADRKARPATGASSLLVIGASAGGPQALAHLLSVMPETFAPASVIVQHLDAPHAPHMASWLATQCKLPVRTAEHGETLPRGTVLLAGTSQHLVLTADGKLAYTAQPLNCLHHPSIDVFFESVAKHWKRRLAGVVLTGMGRDGAEGLKRLRNQRALTIAQDQATSAVYGMPKAAVDVDGAQEVLPLKDIGPRLIDFFKTSRRDIENAC